MIKDRQGDYAVRVCDECGHEQRVNYWNLVKKVHHLCRYCNNRATALPRKGKPAHNRGKQYQAKRVGNYYINNGGYVCLWVGKYADKTKAGGYFLEHRLQMEVALGRSLDSSERVHHVDGDKTNNTLSNLYLCADDFEHQKVHSNLERAAMELVKMGGLIFNHAEGTYSIAPCIREFASKSPELLGNPEKDNQQRSLRDLSSEERSTTIQKWSRLKRAEAGDNSTPTDGVDDIVCSTQ
jgi:hypothetical protein